MKKFLAITVAVLLAASCVSEKQLEGKIANVLKKNPKLLTQAIEDNPADFVEAFQNAVKKAQGQMAERRKQAEEKKLEEAFNNPLQPAIRSDEAIRGPKNAPITLVEYSDFECPFCTRGYKTVNDIMSKYPGKVRFIYKHLPLSFHENAMIASQYFEAIRLQSADKAFKFHDAVFAEQRKLKSGEKFLKALAQKVGADMGRLSKDVNSEAVKGRIDQDMKEAAKFGMQGTPGFIINGIPVKGAYPASHFHDILKKLKAKGKLSIDL
jgi:protein-disulfide isomerase